MSDFEMILLDMVEFCLQNMILHSKIRLRHDTNPFLFCYVSQNKIQQADSYLMAKIVQHTENQCQKCL